ncbi:MAG: HAMP domain-containing sensor histidine kinase [Nitrospirota bacterium]
MILCRVLLTAYLISQARYALLEIALQHGVSVASGVAKEAAIYLHAGDGGALEQLLREANKQPDVIAATVERDGRTWGREISRIEGFHPRWFGGMPNAFGDAARLVKADDHRAIETRTPIVIHQSSDVLSDQTAPGLSLEPRIVGHAVVIVSVERIFAQMDALVARSIGVWALLLGAGLLAGWLISGMMVSPLKQLADSARVWTGGVDQTPSDSSALATHRDEIRSLWGSLTAMKHALDRKTHEVARLQGSFDDAVRLHTADLQDMNRRLSDIIALKNDLLLQVSHEVKTPLTALASLVSNLYDGVTGEFAPRQRKYLAQVMATTNQIKHLLTTLLEFAMAETGRIHLDRRVVDINVLVESALDVLQPFQEGRGISCVVSESLLGVRVVADPDRVQQVLLNLIHNAIKASSPGSTVVIDARTEGSDLTISVRDSGPGVRPSERATLLRQPLPSESRRHGGGVGLYICRYLVELHGGRIWFESEVGNGATFYFTLPASEGTAVSSQSPNRTYR